MCPLLIQKYHNVDGVTHSNEIYFLPLLAPSFGFKKYWT